MTGACGSDEVRIANAFAITAEADACRLADSAEAGRIEAPRAVSARAVRWGRAIGMCAEWSCACFPLLSPAYRDFSLCGFYGVVSIPDLYRIAIDRPQHEPAYIEQSRPARVPAAGPPLLPPPGSSSARSIFG